MKIVTDQDITGLVARNLRNELGMAQAAFWGAVGVKQPIASRYEAGLRIPDPIKSLLFIRYVAGIEYSPSTVPGAEGLRKLASQQQS